jgi:hypothetical protein
MTFATQPTISERFGAARLLGYKHVLLITSAHRRNHIYAPQALDQLCQ